jgi:hypothetical protein
MPTPSARAPHRAAAHALAAALATLVGAPLGAWSPEAQRAIAADAARIAPPDLAGQLARHAREMALGAAEPFEEGRAEQHVKHADGSGALDRALALEVEGAIAALRAFRPLAEVARRLGRVSHWAADLNNPLNSSADDAEEGRYLRDFLLYADSARPRFAVVLYENAEPVADAAGLARLTERALGRGRALYPTIGREYRRIGFGSGLRLFDDRSSAFGVAALAYSHAVSDAARLFRYIWLAGGGGDPRPVLDRARDRVLLLRAAAP